MIGSAQRLPRGRHGLTREQVAGSQRERILRAMADAMAENGYVATSVAEVVRRAGVSRETFYEQFSSKEDCFAAAYEAAAGVILSGAGSEDGAGPADPLERLGRALGAYLDTLAGEPALARLFLLEVYAAGPQALARRAEIQRRFAGRVARRIGARSAADRFACEAFVAATSALVTGCLAADDIDGLRALRRPLTELAARMLSGARPPRAARPPARR